MPLEKSKSKEAFEHNVKAELEAGKPIKQALAISYSTQREAQSKHKDNIASSERDLRNLAAREKHFSTLARKEAQGAIERLKRERQAHMPASAKDTEWEVGVDKHFANLRSEKAKTAHRKLQEKIAMHKARMK
jgi:hypothetical protein